MSKLPSPVSPPSTSKLDPVAQAGPPRAFACAQCHTRVAHTARLVSTAYRGHAGKAALFSAMRNVALDPPSILLMDSGAYTIREFICKTCATYLGWRFVRAHDGPERWKEGLFVLELDFVAVAVADAQTGDADLDPDADDAACADADAAQAARRVAHGLHRRTMSAAPAPTPDGRPPTVTTPTAKGGGVGRGFRNTQAGAGAPRPQTQVLAPRRGDADEYGGGPFWKPR